METVLTEREIALIEEVTSRVVKRVLGEVNKEEEPITLEQAIEYTGLSRHTIYKNGMPREKRGKHLVFYKSQIKDWKVK